MAKTKVGMYQKSVPGKVLHETIKSGKVVSRKIINDDLDIRKWLPFANTARKFGYKVYLRSTYDYKAGSKILSSCSIYYNGPKEIERYSRYID